MKTRTALTTAKSSVALLLFTLPLSSNLAYSAPSTTGEGNIVTGDHGVATGYNNAVTAKYGLAQGNDSVATGVIRGLSENEYKVPGDVSIIGFNDTVVSQYTIPPLTSIGVQVEELGKVAVDLVIEKIKGRNYSKLVIIPTKFIERDSVKNLNSY